MNVSDCALICRSEMLIATVSKKALLFSKNLSETKKVGDFQTMTKCEERIAGY